MEENNTPQEENGYKNVVYNSNILEHEKRNWISTNDQLPDSEECVVIRMYKPNSIMQKYDDKDDPETVHIVPLEDIVVGKCLMDYHDQSIRNWIVCSPHARFEYSPLAQYGHILDGTVVSHWAVPEEGEVEGWQHRFDAKGTYEHFRIQIDEEHLEDLYSLATILQEYCYEQMQMCEEASPDEDIPAKITARRLYILSMDIIGALNNPYGIGALDKKEEDVMIDEMYDRYEHGESEEPDNGEPPYIEFPVNKSESESDQ